MPRFKRPRSAGRKRGSTRRSRKVVLPVRIIRKKRRRLTGARRSGLLPQGKIAYCTYFFTNTLDLGAATHVTHVYSANGAFDPDVSGGGHQSRGFDQYAALYEKYAVVSSKITCKAQCPTNVELYVVSIRTQYPPEANDVDADTIFELHGNRYSSKPGFDNSCKTIKASCILNRFVSGKNIDDSALSATFTAVPAQQVYFKITAVRLGAAAGGLVRIWGTITYKLKLLEPKKLIAS